MYGAASINFIKALWNIGMFCFVLMNKKFPWRSCLETLLKWYKIPRWSKKRCHIPPKNLPAYKENRKWGCSCDCSEMMIGARVSQGAPSVGPVKSLGQPGKLPRATQLGSAPPEAPAAPQPGSATPGRAGQLPGARPGPAPCPYPCPCRHPPAPLSRGALGPTYPAGCGSGSGSRARVRSRQTCADPPRKQWAGQFRRCRGAVLKLRWGCWRRRSEKHCSPEPAGASRPPPAQGGIVPGWNPRLVSVQSAAARESSQRWRPCSFPGRPRPQTALRASEFFLCGCFLCCSCPANPASARLVGWGPRVLDSLACVGRGFASAVTAARVFPASASRGRFRVRCLSQRGLAVGAGLCYAEALTYNKNNPCCLCTNLWTQYECE